MGTPEQRAACNHDVGRFCKTVKPEERPFAYLDCLQKNQEKLRPAFLKVITGGALIAAAGAYVNGNGHFFNLSIGHQAAALI
jgi:hypothetical protein